MKPTTISVVVPTYMRAQLLKQALESVLAQTHVPTEVIVAEDGSSEGTAEVVASFGKNVRHLRLPHSGLPAKVRNAALREAQGEWVAFLDDDDIWAPRKLERQIESLTNGAVISCSNARLIDSEGRPTGRLMHGADPLKGGMNPLERLIGGNFVICSSALVKTELLSTVGGFCEDERLARLGEDYDLWIRCALRGTICYLHEPLLDLRVSDHGNLSHSSTLLERAHALEHVRNRTLAQMAGQRHNFESAFRANDRLIAHLKYKGHFENGQWFAALPYWLRVQANKLSKHF